MFEKLLKDAEGLNTADYSEMLISLYEDEDAYTAEIVFDDDRLILGRTDRRYILAKNDADFSEIIKTAKRELKTYFSQNKERYRHIKSIAYGFVDGDLYYIKKQRKRKKDVPYFSKENFASFDDVRLKAWLTVYLNEEGKQKYESELLNLCVNFNGFTEEEKDRWCEILARYFDYKKYENL